MSMFASNTQLRIVELRLQETGTFDPQYGRGYQAEIHQNNLDSLARRIEETMVVNPHGSINNSLLSGLACGIIFPSNQVEGQVHIANGWQERRFRFTLVVEEVSTLGTHLYHYQGYSEFFAISHGGNIDPNMVFFINSYIRILRMANPSVLGGFTDKIVESRTITNGRAVTGGNSVLYGLRPVNMFQGIQRNHITGSYENGQLGSGVIDPRFTLSNEVFSTGRNSSIPSNYLGNIINSYRGAQTVADYGTGTENVYERAINTSYELSPFENKFIRDLSLARGATTPVSDFTLNNLVVMDPTIGSRINYMPVEDHGALSYAGGDYGNWNALDTPTRIASTLSRAIPALMLECGLITCHFHSTNMTMGQEIVTNMIAPGVTVSTDSPMSLYNQFIMRYNTEIHPDISYFNRLGISIAVDADVYNEITIHIGVDSAVATTYKYPCFCDGMLQPTMTSSADSFSSMVNGVEDVINYCGIDNTPSLSSMFAVQSV